MRQLATLTLLLFLLPLSSAFARAERPQDAPAGLVEAGAPAPDFTLADLAGKSVTLSQYRGKVVFLNFWASWCPPCRAEMPSMQRLYEVYAGDDFVMLAVNIEQDAGAVRDFIQKNPHTFPVLLDPEATAQRLYGVDRFPETFLLDRQGRVIERYLGARDWSSVEFLKKIKSLLKE